MSHWSDRLKQNLVDTGRFFADFGIPLGLTVTGVMSACAVTATLAAGGTENTLVAQEMNSLAAAIGTTGILSGGYMVLASIWCEKLMNKLGVNENPDLVSHKDLMDHLQGKGSMSASQAVSGLLKNQESMEVMNQVIRSSPIENELQTLMSYQRLNTTSHEVPSSEVKSEEDNQYAGPTI